MWPIRFRALPFQSRWSRRFVWWGSRYRRLSGLMPGGRSSCSSPTSCRLNKRRAYRVIALGVLLVSIPLFVASVRVYRNSIAQTKITTITNQWVREYSTDIVVRSVLVSGGGAKILITGPERPSSIADLGAKIKSEVEHVAEVDLRYFPSQDYQYR
jgi:hypothetical protein